MSISNIGNWLGSRWGGFPPWDRGAGYGRTDMATKRSKREKAPKWLYIRTFGCSDVALILNKRPFFPFWEYLVIIDVILAHGHIIGAARSKRHGQSHFITMNYTKLLFWIIANQSAVIAAIIIYTTIQRYYYMLVCDTPYYILYTMILCDIIHYAI